MNIQRFAKGDFVRLRKDSSEANGIIIDVHQNNETKSRHVEHISDSYSYVYYVLIGGSEVQGPYFPDELLRVS